MLDVFIAILFGLIGYWLRKMKYPLAPLVVAIVLGDSTEKTFRQSLIASGGNPGIFFGSPLAAILMVFAIALLLLPAVRSIRARRHPAVEPSPYVDPID
jgi:putative tricarboxylic transport membrane protein